MKFARLCPPAPGAAPSTSRPAASSPTAALDEANDIEGDLVRSRMALERENRKLQVLMDCVIPRHLVSEMRQDLMAPKGAQRRNFEKYYMEYYESVSILFADIVGFTNISSNCRAEELVAMLNELFGRFDEAAQTNKCLRIKILGDCYYCVSGVPASGPKPEPHARQCVEMGLDMIDILDELVPHMRAPMGRPESLRPDEEKRLKMRIGIHTGQVLCGIMGKKKWQFDVYSYDVMLANHMEQSGMPGRVHITEATLKHLDNQYQVEPANGRKRDSYIAALDIETYFVTTPSERRKDSAVAAAAGDQPARGSGAGSAGPAGEPAAAQQVAAASLVVDQSGRSALLDSGAEAPRLAWPLTPARAARSAEHLEAAAVAPPAPQPPDEAAANQAAAGPPAPHSGTSGGLQVRGLPAADTIVTINQNNETVSLLAPGGLAGGLDGAAGPARDAAHASGPAGPVKSESHQSIQMRPLPASLTRPDLRPLSPGSLPSKLNRFKRTTRALMNASHFIRTIDPPFANLDSESSVNIDKIICDTKAERGHIRDVSKWTLRFEDPELARLYRQESGQQQQQQQQQQRPGGWGQLGPALAKHKRHAVLTLAAGLMAALALAYVALARGADAAPSTTAKVYHHLISAAAALLLLLISLALAGALAFRLHQAELNSRRNFVLRQKAIKDKASLEQMSECNRQMLYNILPKHVAEYYLESFLHLPKRLAHKEFYSRSYKMVGVSFATVTNFYKDFYEEDDVNEHGKGCLNLLNEILCDFDDLLNRDQFKMIDKIKTIGTTYMSAVGLCLGSGRLPRRRPSGAAGEPAPEADRPAAGSPREEADQLRTMLEFIRDMRDCLREISDNSFHEYKMRAGVNVGPVTAGVIGATKPQYDIWGNTVNVASRMESTCEPNEIQVTEEVYRLLASFFDDIQFRCRGEIDVKGKGKMTTYYVDMPPRTETPPPPGSPEPPQ